MNAESKFIMIKILIWITTFQVPIVKFTVDYNRIYFGEANGIRSDSNQMDLIYIINYIVLSIEIAIVTMLA